MFLVSGGSLGNPSFVPALGGQGTGSSSRAGVGGLRPELTWGMSRPREQTTSQVAAKTPTMGRGQEAEPPPPPQGTSVHAAQHE